jgi:protein transport protein SEC61 subunit alpha
MHGDIHQLGYVKVALIMAQLMTAGTFVILLDDMLQKGHGLGTGITAFVGTNVCGAILIKTFGFSSIMTSNGAEYEGVVNNLFYSIFAAKDKLWSIQHAITRSDAPNLIGLLGTAAIMLIVIFVQCYRVQIYISAKKARGHKQPYPIRLLYVNNIPILMHTALISNYYFFCYLFQSFVGNNFATTILGRWSQVDPQTGLSHMESGIGYFLSPPRTLWELFTDPIHTVFYVSFVLFTFGFICKIWIQVNGTSARDVAKQLIENDMTMEGMRDGPAMIKHLDRYITIAAQFGGVAIGAMTIAADLVGALGSGTGTVLGVTIVYQYFEMLAKERQQMGGEGWGI